MRHSKTKWKRNDLKTLYEGCGFIIKVTGKKQDKIWHPKYPQFVTFLPRHRKLGEFVIDDAVRLVDRLIRLEKQEVQNGSQS